MAALALKCCYISFMAVNETVHIMYKMYTKHIDNSGLKQYWRRQNDYGCVKVISAHERL